MQTLEEIDYGDVRGVERARYEKVHINDLDMRETLSNELTMLGIQAVCALYIVVPQYRPVIRTVENSRIPAIP